jgi:hypothetical protein
MLLFIVRNFYNFFRLALSDYSIFASSESYPTTSKTIRVKVIFSITLIHRKWVYRKKILCRATNVDFRFALREAKDNPQDKAPLVS